MSSQIQQTYPFTYNLGSTSFNSSSLNKNVGTALSLTREAQFMNTQSNQIQGNKDIQSTTKVFSNNNASYLLRKVDSQTVTQAQMDTSQQQQQQQQLQLLNITNRIEQTQDKTLTQFRSQIRNGLLPDLSTNEETKGDQVDNKIAQHTIGQEQEQVQAVYAKQHEHEHEEVEVTISAHAPEIIIDKLMTQEKEEEKLEKERYLRQIDHLRDQLQRKKYEIATCDQEISIENMKLTQYEKQNQILRIMMVFCLLALLLMTLIPKRKDLQDGNTYRVSYESQQSMMSSQGYEYEIHQFEDNQSNITKSNQEELITHESMNIQSSEPRDDKFLVLSRPKAQPHTKPIYNQYFVNYRIESMMKSLYDFNRTLVNQFEEFMDENYNYKANRAHDCISLEPQPMRKFIISKNRNYGSKQPQSKPFSLYEQRQMNLLSGYLLKKNILVDPLVRKILDKIPREHFMIKVLLKELELDIQQCKVLMTQQYSSFIRNYYQQEIDEIESIDQEFQQRQSFSPLRLRLALDEVLYGQCFKNFRKQSTELLRRL